MKRHCAMCGQRLTFGHDPDTGEPWQQCGCTPYPAKIKYMQGGTVAVRKDADPTPEEIAAWCATKHRPKPTETQAMLEDLAADVATIAVKLHGPTIQAAEAPDMTDLQEHVFIAPPESHSPQRMGPGVAKRPSRRAQAEAGAKHHNGKSMPR